ncbi:hypothetical protein KIPB_006939, partial [Kipferlia bialata]
TPLSAQSPADMLHSAVDVTSDRHAEREGEREREGGIFRFESGREGDSTRSTRSTLSAISSHSAHSTHSAVSESEDEGDALPLHPEGIPTEALECLSEAELRQVYSDEYARFDALFEARGRPTPKAHAKELEREREREAEPVSEHTDSEESVVIGLPMYPKGEPGRERESEGEESPSSGPESLDLTPEGERERDSEGEESVRSVGTVAVSTIERLAIAPFSHASAAIVTTTLPPGVSPSSGSVGETGTRAYLTVSTSGDMTRPSSVILLREGTETEDNETADESTPTPLPTLHFLPGSPVIALCYPDVVDFVTLSGSHKLPSLPLSQHLDVSGAEGVPLVVTGSGYLAVVVSDTLLYVAPPLSLVNTPVPTLLTRAGGVLTSAGLRWDTGMVTSDGFKGPGGSLRFAAHGVLTSTSLSVYGETSKGRERERGGDREKEAARRERRRHADQLAANTLSPPSPPSPPLSSMQALPPHPFYASTYGPMRTASCGIEAASAAAIQAGSRGVSVTAGPGVYTGSDRGDLPRAERVPTPQVEKAFCVHTLAPLSPTHSLAVLCLDPSLDPPLHELPGLGGVMPNAMGWARTPPGFLDTVVGTLQQWPFAPFVARPHSFYRSSYPSFVSARANGVDIIDGDTPVRHRHIGVVGSLCTVAAGLATGPSPMGGAGADVPGGLFARPSTAPSPVRPSPALGEDSLGYSNEQEALGAPRNIDMEASSVQAAPSLPVYRAMPSAASGLVPLHLCIIQNTAAGAESVVESIVSTISDYDASAAIGATRRRHIALPPDRAVLDAAQVMFPFGSSIDLASTVAAHNVACRVLAGGGHAEEGQRDGAHYVPGFSHSPFATVNEAVVPMGDARLTMLSRPVSPYFSADSTRAMTCFDTMPSGTTITADGTSLHTYHVLMSLFDAVSHTNVVMLLSAITVSAACPPSSSASQLGGAAGLQLLRMLPVDLDGRITSLKMLPTNVRTASGSKNGTDVDVSKACILLAVV